MDTETNSELLQDIEELIEEHLISHNEEVVEQGNIPHPPMSPLTSSWVLEARSGAGRHTPASYLNSAILFFPRYIHAEFKLQLDPPEIRYMLNSQHSSLNIPIFFEDPEQLEEYFKIPLEDLPLAFEVSKKSPEETKRNYAATTSEGFHVKENNHKPSISEKRPLKKRPARTPVIVVSDSFSEDDTAAIGDSKSKRPHRISRSLRNSTSPRVNPPVSEAPPILKTMPVSPLKIRYHSVDLLKHVHVTIDQIINCHPAIRALVTDTEVH
ncbi:uncharacterized protein LOC121315295 isoform X2 [Polyodon spathula]|uniref:uncharacterized protein LOC121315295 isoform X2 n=1 Tax=Polyodon spathula TaxID=7913 RepID=UPI001B7DBBAF|nr:uncharacterized protein LOC121315295 isoform X2 [Polyodon spathula]